MFSILALLFCSALAATLVASGTFTPGTYTISGTSPMLPVPSLATFTPTAGKLYEIDIKIIGRKTSGSNQENVQIYKVSGSGTYSNYRFHGITDGQGELLPQNIAAPSTGFTNNVNGFMNSLTAFYAANSTNLVIGFRITVPFTDPDTTYVLEAGIYRICEVL